jgi:hypothetical protein
MRLWSAIVALLALAADVGVAQTPTWHVDVVGTALFEAWDYNQSRELLGGISVGAERRVWKALQLRTEGLILRVNQEGPDAWLRGLIVGARGRWQASHVNPFVDVAVGVSSATTRVPARGTAFNYLVVVGGGIRIPVRNRMSLDLGGRWLHLSNNGREGDHRNPDIQALGPFLAIGWSY